MVTARSFLMKVSATQSFGCVFLFKMDTLSQNLRRRIASQIRQAVEWMDQGPLNEYFLAFCNKLESMEPLNPESTRTWLLLAGYTPNISAIYRPGRREIEYDISILSSYEDIN